MKSVFVNITAIGGRGSGKTWEIERIKKALEPLGYHVFMTATKQDQPIEVVGMSQSWGSNPNLDADFIEKIKAQYLKAELNA